jgi:predicted secreted protein
MLMMLTIAIIKLIKTSWMILIFRSKEMTKDAYMKYSIQKVIKEMFIKAHVILENTNLH